MRGRRIGRDDATLSGERRLLCALVAQALHDAKMTGSMEAARWLDEEGPAVARLLGFDVGVFADWRTRDVAISAVVRGQLATQGGPVETPAERGRRYRERKKQAAEAAKNRL